jgi:hypothetical protein
MTMQGQISRKKRAMFVDTRDANVGVLNSALASWPARREFELITVGPVEELAENLPRTTLPETDEPAT